MNNFYWKTVIIKSNFLDWKVILESFDGTECEGSCSINSAVYMVNKNCPVVFFISYSSSNYTGMIVELHWS